MSQDRTIRPFSPEEQRAFFADEVPITGDGIAYLASAAEVPVPVVAVDPAGRPDLQDLGRVLRLEPAGSDSVGPLQIGAYFRPPVGFVLISASFTSPADCSLKLIFRLPRQSQLVQAVVDAPKFVISPGPIDADGEFDASRGIVLTCSDPDGFVRWAIEQVKGWPAR